MMRAIAFAAGLAMVCLPAYAATQAEAEAALQQRCVRFRNS